MSQRDEEGIGVEAPERSSRIVIPPRTNEYGASGASEQSSELYSRENGEVPRKVSSTQVLIGDRKTTSISASSLNYDSDDTLSGEESMEDLDVLNEEGKKDSGLNGNNALTGQADTGASSLSTIAVPETNSRRSSTPFIEKKGFLYKMGGHRKSWKNRYFVLRPGIFQYFKDTKCQKMLGEVKLKNLNIFFPGAGERKQSYQFTLHTESSWNRRPDYVMAAQSEKEMKEWISAFKLAGQVMNPASGDNAQ